MLGLIPNFLSRLRKNRHWCAFFSTAYKCIIHSFICVSRPCEVLSDVNAEEFKAVYPLHMCFVDVMGVCSLLCLLKSTTSSLVLSMLGERCLLTPFSPGTNLLSVERLIIVSDQAYHRCVVSKFDNDVGPVCCCTAVCVQGVQEWAEDAALRSTSVEDQGRCPMLYWEQSLTDRPQYIQSALPW